MVLLNYPRTGSTWMRGVLRRLHGVEHNVLARPLAGTRVGWRGFHELKLPIDRTATARSAQRRSQHGCWRQIPAWAGERQVVSVGRHPLAYLHSAFHHGYWRTSPAAPADTIRARLPAFPDLDLAGYLDYLEQFALPDVLQGAEPRAEIGALTAHFLRFFHPRPQQALDELTEARLDGIALLDELPAVRFLRTERLRDDFTALLADQGYAGSAVRDAMEASDRNASAPPPGDAGAPRPDSIERLLHRERLLARLFPLLPGSA